MTLSRLRLPAPLQPLGELGSTLCYRLLLKTPNGPGSQGHKSRLVRRVLADDARLALFSGKEPLPSGYGVGVDERCVEYPWAVRHLRGSGGLLLDAGSVLNNELLLTHPVIAAHDIHIMTLAPEPDCYWYKGISYIFADLRRQPARDGLYDAVVCLSTLEHVGCDNSHYTGRDSGRDAEQLDYTAAVREMARVLRPGGFLLISVPFGRPDNLGWLQVFDEPMVNAAVTAFGPAREREVCYFRYSVDGWNASTAAESADMAYATWMGQGPSHRFWPIREHDDAAAARAVACLRLVKA